MSGKGSEILNKVIGAALMVASAGFFADVQHAPLYLLPGVLFGAGGFVLALRRDRREGLELEAQRRLDRLTEGLAATQQELGAMQERLDRLGEERDFMRQLGSPGGARVAGDALRASAAAPGVAGSPGGARGPTEAALSPGEPVPGTASPVGTTSSS